jgi:hypothetical protein
MKNIIRGKRGIFFVVILVAVVIFGFFAIKNKIDKNKNKEQQKVEDSRQQRMSTASWSRVSFFETLPINVTFAMPSYLEGNYRLVKGGSQATFLYIKDPSNPVEMLSIKVFSNAEFNLPSGDIELASKCDKYKFSYKLADKSSYNGSDGAGFSQALEDIKFFLTNDGYFECRTRE